jgi:hypothetical protein
MNWRGLLDRFLADPKAVVDGVKKYISDVENGADPIEALHGHVCSPKCWHQQIYSKNWPDRCPKCGLRHTIGECPTKPCWHCGVCHTGDLPCSEV